MPNVKTPAKPQPKKKKKPVKKPEIIRESIQAEYHFSDKEKQELGANLASLITRREEIKQEKAQIVSQYAAREKEVSAQISGLSNKITAGVEIRPRQVLVEYETKRGMKQFFSDDKKHTLIREEPMTPSDWQLPMFRKEDVESKAPPAAPPSPPSAPSAAPAAQAPKGKAAKPPKSSPAGETNVGDAMDKAAAGTTAPPIWIDLDRGEGWTPGDLKTEFKKATKAAGWKPAQISTLADLLSRAEDHKSMIETLRPHVMTAEDRFVEAAGGKVLRLSVELPDGFPLVKVAQLFRSAAKKADWPEPAIEEVIGEAERQARVLADEPEATETATRYLRNFTTVTIVT